MSNLDKLGAGEMLLKHNLKTLRLPTMLAEHTRLSREAADSNQGYDDYLLKLTELEVAQRGANAIAARIKHAGFPILKDLETFDFTLTPAVNKQKILELARCEWIGQRSNAALIGNSGTGKTHLTVALGQAACRAGKRVKFYTAQALVNQLEDQPTDIAGLRRNDAEDVEIIVLRLLDCARTGADLRPYPRDRAVLAEACFVFVVTHYTLVGMGRFELIQTLGQFCFLKASNTAGSVSGCVVRGIRSL